MADQTASPRAETVVPADYGAEAFVESLIANGVEFMFINSGTDIFPIQEALAKFDAKGRTIPRAVLCPDEATAVAAAHGYFMVTRRPQVVLVHVDSGTMNMGGGLHNAQRGRAGMILCAGRAPMTFDGELEGTRNISIHWIQEQLDQAGAMRGFTKWDYELRRTENIQHVMQRAFQIAASEPPGPVYLTLPREILMESVGQTKVLPVQRHGPLSTPQADADDLAQAAEALANAENPLIVAGQSGRNPSSVAAMTRLAELTGARVASESNYVNFPTDHPLWASAGAAPHIADADVILAVDSDVPYIPAHGKPNPNATIIHIDIDPVKPTIPLWVFPVDQLMHADSAKAVPALADAVDDLLSDADRARIEERIETIKQHRETQIQQADDLAKQHGTQSVITPQWLSYCLGQAVDEDTVIVDESVTNSGHISNYVPRTKPGTYYKSGGSSLGWALGGAIGARFAQPDKTVVATVGDGAFIYGCPASSLWAADVHDAPFLTIIYNNQIHNAPKASLKGAYPDGYALSSGNLMGMELSPSVEFATLAESCRAYGEKVEDPAEVPAALERALEQVRNGRAAVLDVRIEKP
ncbi:MAG: thiamine pyrophosphate-requiring protein [SAR202 cluster bacterium]|jgi:acetolactate synthase-1/2/3 large subunit|nr:acetolactate synthase [Chloroflexota bacterium]MDP6419896.1 thiamine pyrophosphate-requiring protein [SAR202 cluster bacterium]HAL49654.1 thiamine pyrophosphate-requiring protein [Dehalococcoidia bacterium]MDP6664152.1 thiamine pyrophosphate-requiring protein [SAR202 cluster bacterium]MDP6800353.1 thiamine pyrophosphate-requiring protein [SAR202 cluster bacterium]|tara:strand:+ start:5349 stop:7100 length:1752 start_codon:yes stop_codon:yes gene_type:complete